MDFGDFLLILGAALLVGGLYLFDYRLAILASGVLLMIAGVIRLRNKSAEDFENRGEI